MLSLENYWMLDLSKEFGSIPELKRYTKKYVPVQIQHTLLGNFFVMGYNKKTKTFDDLLFTLTHALVSITSRGVYVNGFLRCKGYSYEQIHFQLLKSNLK